MALIEYDAYTQQLRELEPELEKLKQALDIDSAAQEAARLEDETTQDGFWNDLERSQKIQTRLKQLQNKVNRFRKLTRTGGRGRRDAGGDQNGVCRAGGKRGGGPDDHTALR